MPPCDPCPHCAGPLVPLGVLGRLEHLRCRDCGLDVSRPLGPDEPGQDDLDAWGLEHAPALDDVLDGILGGVLLDPERNS